MEASSDLERLRGMLEVPPGVRSARWVVEKLGDGGSFLPGPTDLRLLALLSPFDALAELGEVEGERALVLSAEAASALLGAPLGREVRGQGYDAAKLSSARFRATTALRAGDGVLVAAVSS